MTTLPITDTHRFIKRLQETGMPESQAKTLVDELQQIDLDHLVSKEHLDKRLSELKADVFKWVIPLLLGQVALFTAIVGALMSWILTVLN